MPIEELTISHADAEGALAKLNETWGRERPVTITGVPGGLSFEFHSVSAPTVGADRIRWNMQAHAVLAPTGFFSALTVLDGRYERFGTSTVEHPLRQGAVAMHPQDEECVAVLDRTASATLRLPYAVVDRVAAERLGAAGRVRFSGLLPVSASAARRWRQLTRFVHDSVRGEEPVLSHALVEGQIAELIAATALVTFPNDTMGDAAPAPRDLAAPASIRRAMAFIDASASEPITITDIAQAAGVSPRTLQYGFARHYDTSPTSYLRTVRLAAVRRELSESDPGSGTSVGAVARRWGFGHLGRFAAEYRAAYDELPHETLGG